MNFKTYENKVAFFLIIENGRPLSFDTKEQRDKRIAEYRVDYANWLKA